MEKLFFVGQLINEDGRKYADVYSSDPSASCDLSGFVPYPPVLEEVPEPGNVWEQVIVI